MYRICTLFVIHKPVFLSWVWLSTPNATLFSSTQVNSIHHSSSPLCFEKQMEKKKV